MNIPTALLLEAKEASGAKTQTSAVILGLKELIRKRRMQEVSRFFGKGGLKLTQADLRKMRGR